MLFRNILFPKEFLECTGYISSYLPKLDSGLKLVSGAHVLHILSMNNSLYDTLSIDQVSISQTFFTSQDIKQFLFLNSSLDT